MKSTIEALALHGVQPVRVRVFVPVVESGVDQDGFNRVEHLRECSTIDEADAVALADGRPLVEIDDYYVIVKNDEVQKLKLKAHVSYAEDGGYMCECSDDADYVAMIEEDGTAADAWEWHMRILSVHRENCAVYDAE